MLDGAGADEEIKARVASIRSLIAKKTSSDFDREKLLERWLAFWWCCGYQGWCCYRNRDEREETAY